MQCIDNIQDLREQIQQWRKLNQEIALVPTMGNLHKGHLSLVEQAKQVADHVVVSIFVNPTQFVAGEDFEEYPRTLEDDLSLLDSVGADTVFNPQQDEIYPQGSDSQLLVTVPQLENILCGEYRPGHFAGVALVVAKLFNIVEPDHAIFGEKDYQQLLVIKQLVRDLCLPVNILSGSTIREEDGLAVSSRNAYLNEKERKLAPAIYKILQGIELAIIDGNIDYSSLENNAIKELDQSGFRTEYLKIKDAVNLAEPGNRDLVVLTATWLGKARLIDNIIIRR